MAVKWAVNSEDTTLEENFIKVHVEPTPTENFPKERLKTNE